MWQSRPVFISSTFADMQAERDFLRTRVFPELEERLRARRHSLEWVDLRIGVATASERDEHVRELHVLKVCLDEVRRCRPFLIVLLGDRYGWVPPEERIKAAAEEAREGFSADVAGRSVTDLEIEFGVLSDAAQQLRSFFYLREPLPYTDMPTEVAALYCEDFANDSAHADRKERLAGLKRRIGEQMPSRVRRYAAAWDGEHHRVAGLDDFGRIVLDDIWSELETESRTSAAAADLPWHEAERQALDDFIDDRARDFVGRQGILDSLTSLVTAAESAVATWGACVAGDAGSGKSALFGALYRRLQGSDVFLLAHAAGASVNAASVDSMLRRFVGELAAALGTDPGLEDNADPDTVDAAFARHLGQMAQRRRVVVLVDALDQFENTTRGRYVTWLPRSWPANARLIATAIPGEASKALGERHGLEALSLPPLDAAEARDIVAGICRRYHRTFESEVIDALLSKSGSDGPAWGNPLWLVLAVEDLNLLDADDFARAHRDYPGDPAERLRALMLDTVVAFPPDIPGLYAHTFERAENVFGANLTRGFLGLVAVSRAGWREADFRILLPRASGKNWDELQFAQLRRLFRGQLRRRGGLAQWDFSHAQMRAAARARLVGVSEQSLHSLIADRLLSCPPDDPLHISETMVHLLGSEGYERAASYYGDSSLSEAELQGATRVLADALTAPRTGNSASAAQQLCRLVDVPDDSVCTTVAEHFLIQLRDAIEQVGLLDARNILSKASKRTFERLLRTDPGNAGWQRDLSLSHDNIGDVQLAQGDLAGAMQSYRDSLAIAQRLAQSNPGHAGWQRDLSVSYNKIGDVQMAQGDLAGVLKSYRDFLAIQEELVQSGPDYLTIQEGLVQFGNAGRRRDLAKASHKVGDVLKAQGDLAGALQSYRYSLETFEALARSEPRNGGWQHNLSASHSKVGDVLKSQGDLAGTLKCYRDSLAIIERLAQSDPGNAGVQHDLSAAHERIGDLLKAQGDLAGALQSHRDGLAISERLARSDPGNMGWQCDLSVAYDRVGNVLEAHGDLAGTLKSYGDSLAILERLARSNPGNAGIQRGLALAYDRIGTVLKTQGDLASALKFYRDSLAIREQLGRSDPGNADCQHDLSAQYLSIGDVLKARGDLAGALQSYRESLAIMERLARSDPEHALWQAYLSVPYASVGDVLKAQGDLPGALKSYRDSLAIRDRLAQSDPDNAIMQNDLSVSYCSVGDVQAALGDLAGALQSYGSSLAIFEHLARSDPGDAVRQADLSVSYNRVGEVQAALGDLAGARKSYSASLAIREGLVQSDPNKVVWQHDLAASHGRLGLLSVRLGVMAEALDSLRQGRDILARLAALFPDNPQLKQDVASFDGEIARLTKADAPTRSIWSRLKGR